MKSWFRSCCYVGICLQRIPKDATSYFCSSMCWLKVFVVSIHEFIQVVQVLVLSMLFIFKVTLANHQKNIFPTSKLSEVKSTVFQEVIQDWRLNKTCLPKAVSQHQPCLQVQQWYHNPLPRIDHVCMFNDDITTHTPAPPISWVDSTVCTRSTVLLQVFGPGPPLASYCALTSLLWPQYCRSWPWAALKQFGFCGCSLW